MNALNIDRTPPTVNITIWRGDRFYWGFDLKTNGVKDDLTGRTGRMMIRSNPGGDVIATAEVVLSDDPDTPSVTVSLTEAQTAALPDRAGYDIELTNPTKTLLTGKIRAKGEYTYD